MKRPTTTPIDRSELEALIAKARSAKSMTEYERFEQAVSFVYGNAPEESTLTKAEVRIIVAQERGRPEWAVAPKSD